MIFLISHAHFISHYSYQMWFVSFDMKMCTKLATTCNSCIEHTRTELLTRQLTLVDENGYGGGKGVSSQVGETPYCIAGYSILLS